MENLYSILKSVYTQEEIASIIEALDPVITQPAPPKDSTWYKRLQMYSVYPDSFATNGSGNLVTLTEQLEYIRQLGMNTIHILPLYQSPMIDGGFDISDHMAIRGVLGGNDAFDTLLTSAREKNLAVFIDLVLNHVSHTHKWFQKALAGDEFFRDFFVWQTKQPLLLEIYQDEDGTFAVYEIDAQPVAIKVIFPEHTGDIPHWVQGTDGNWYYHTFYPYQIDINWHNPHVFIEYAKILCHWTNRGVYFRLDAITRVGKQWQDGMKPSTPATHALIKALHLIQTSINPSGVFLLENNEPILQQKKYCGTEETKEAELAYNFYLTEHLWIALIMHDSHYIWNALTYTSDMPEWFQWITFLRNHDALSLKHCNEKTREQVCRTLLPHGLSFRHGYEISGRTASFLEENERRIVMAHLLLASLPGNPCLIYGDEIGKGNDTEYMYTQAELKRRLTEDPTIQPDTRDSNRGLITPDQLKSTAARHLYQEISRIFQIRQQYIALATQTPKQLDTHRPAVWGAQYQLGPQSLDIFINLSEETFTLPYQQDATIRISINSAQLENNGVQLPPFGGLWLYNS